MGSRDLVERFWDRVWLHADVEGGAAYVADDVVFHLFGAASSGVENWKQSAQSYFTAFPNFSAPIDYVLTEGDMVASGGPDQELIRVSCVGSLPLVDGWRSPE